VVVENLSQGQVLDQSNVRQGLVEAGDCAAVHFLVLSIAAVHPDDRGLVAIGVGVGAGPAECFGPIRRESLAVLWVDTVAERVADHLVGHNPAMPRNREAK